MTQHLCFACAVVYIYKYIGCLVGSRDYCFDLYMYVCNKSRRILCFRCLNDCTASLLYMAKLALLKDVPFTTNYLNWVGVASNTNPIHMLCLELQIRFESFEPADQLYDANRVL